MHEKDNKKFIHVAVGVVVNSKLQVCITQRQENQHLAGFWEFPGGKLEAGESTEEALKRELAEEIGISFREQFKLIQIKHSYPNKNVFLDVLIVQDIMGEAKGREGQALQWVNVEQLEEVNFPEANIPIVKAVVDWKNEKASLSSQCSSGKSSDQRSS